MTPLAVVLHDDERQLRLVESLLTEQGFDVRGVRGAYDVLAGELAPDTALIVLGLTALEERDLELVGLLRARLPHARILLLHPASLRDRAARALVEGADGCLQEPFYPSELTAIADRARTPAPASTPSTAGLPAPGPDREASGRPRADDEALEDEADEVAQLAAGIAHSLRNPLQILELLLASAEIGDPLDVDKAQVQFRRIADVATSLTRFTVGREAEPMPVDFHALVRQTFIGRGSTDGPRPRLSLDERTPFVLAQPESLRTALDALRERAERVSPPGAELRIETGLRMIAGEPVVDLDVTDAGPALDDDRLRELFEPFPDPAAPHQTAWIELAAFAGIVRNHGGTTQAHRAGSAGTRIRVTLPVHPPPEHRRAPEGR